MFKRIAIGTVVLVVVLYGAGVAYLYFNQRAFFFFPQGEVLDLTETVLEADLVNFLTEEGRTLTGWYAEPAPGRPVILYYKGNSGSFTAEHERYEAFQAAGYGVFAFDYRGFPASPGELSQDNILADALAAFDWVAERGAPTLIWGRSLGAAPAVWVASQREAQALLLESPFYSAATVARERYPFVPVDLLMLDPFPTHEWIGQVEEPVMIVHGDADTTIGVSNGERLHADVPNPAGLRIVPGAGHADLWAADIWDMARDFFDPAP